MNGVEEYIMSEKFSELPVYFVGRQKCEPGHSWAHELKDRFLIHYVLSGKGSFSCCGREYELTAGNAFFIGSCRGSYRADIREPWEYAWIAFSGERGRDFLKVLGLTPENPIYRTKNPERIAECFRKITAKRTEENYFQLYAGVLSLMGEMLAESDGEIFTEKPAPDKYVNACCEYVRVNLGRKITAHELCGIAMIEYSYLFRLFKRQLGISPGEYIINHKLEHAKKYLAESDMTVAEVSAAVGYDDSSAFSRLFKRKYGVSPKQYRQMKIT